MAGLSERLSGSSLPEVLVTGLPESPALADIADRVRRTLTDCAPTQPQPYDLQETHRELAAVGRKEKKIEDLSRKHIARAPWVMFDNQEAGEAPHADNKRLLRAYLSHVQAEARSAVVLNLASCFLLYYPVDLRRFGEIREATRRLLRSGRGQRVARLTAADQQFDLFGSEGPATVAAAVLDGESAIEQTLEGAALGGQLVRSRFAVESFRAAIRLVAQGLGGQGSPGGRLERLLEWSTLRSVAGAELMYPSARIELAEALLQPFSSEADHPDVATRVKSYMLHVYGDPRLSRENWQGISPGAEQVMLRWLVESTLEDFFRFVAHVSSHDPEADRHWTYRHAFWQSYLRAGVIEQAWVAFGAKAAAEAEQRFQDSGAAYGRIRSGQNVKPIHAVLLLKVGDLIVTEWSHVGKYRIWTADNTSTPRFYRTEYRRDELVTDPDLEGSHHGSESGNWQRKLAQAIRQRTGISIPLKELLPDGRRKT